MGWALVIYLTSGGGSAGGPASITMQSLDACKVALVNAEKIGSYGSFCINTQTGEIIVYR